LPHPPDLSAMLALLPENPLRRTNKLRKPQSRISATPPVLAPLSFIEEPEPDLDFEHVSHDVTRSSAHSSQHSLTIQSVPSQDAPSPQQCEYTLRPIRRLTKRRKSNLAPQPQHQVVPSSSGAAAAAAMTGNPSASIGTLSQMSRHNSSSAPRACSDIGHGLRHSVSIKRANIIRRLSMRTPKPSFDSQATNSGMSSSTGGPPTPTSPTSGPTGLLLKWCGAVSELGHDSMNDDPPIFRSLPLVRITSPLSINNVRKPFLLNLTLTG
jgi:hypothetical protein